MAIGKNVQRLRERRGLTFDAVARAVGTDPQAISQMEKRDSKTSSFGAQLARFFNVRLEDLLREDFDPDQAPRPEVREEPPSLQYQWVSSEESDLITAYRTTDDRGRELIRLTATSVPKVVLPGLVSNQT